MILHQQAAGFHIAAPGSDTQSSLRIPAFAVRIGAAFQQKRRNFRFFRVHCVHHRGIPAVAGFGVDVGAGIQKQPYNLQIPAADRHRQQRIPADILQIGVETGLQKQSRFFFLPCFHTFEKIFRKKRNSHRKKTGTGHGRRFFHRNPLAFSPDKRRKSFCVDEGCNSPEHRRRRFACIRPDNHGAQVPAHTISGKKHKNRKRPGIRFFGGNHKHQVGGIFRKRQELFLHGFHRSGNHFFEGIRTRNGIQFTANRIQRCRRLFSIKNNGFQIPATPGGKYTESAYAKKNREPRRRDSRMPSDRIELSTQGFSVLCSTN